MCFGFFFFFSSRRRHTRCLSDWSSDGALPIYSFSFRRKFSSDSAYVKDIIPHRRPGDVWFSGHGPVRRCGQFMPHVRVKCLGYADRNHWFSAGSRVMDFQSDADVELLRILKQRGQCSKIKIEFMKIRSLILSAAAALVALTGGAQSFRPPSVPLVTFDPFLSIWSGADRLTDRNTQHWTKHEHSLVSLIVRQIGRAHV